MCATFKENLNGQKDLLVYSIFYNNIDEKTGKTLTIFFLDSNGEASSSTEKAELEYELLFDVDPANNAIIYVRGGRPWKLTLE